MSSKKQRTKNKARSKSGARGGAPRSYGNLYSDEQGTKPRVSAAETVVDAKRESKQDVNWGAEYAYVLGDLRQLIVVSALVLVLMIVAGFMV